VTAAIGLLDCRWVCWAAASAAAIEWLVVIGLAAAPGVAASPPPHQHTCVRQAVKGQHLARVPGLVLCTLHADVAADNIRHGGCRRRGDGTGGSRKQEWQHASVTNARGGGDPHAANACELLQRSGLLGALEQQQQQQQQQQQHRPQQQQHQAASRASSIRNSQPSTCRWA
jgi:hypothetical protein